MNNARAGCNAEQCGAVQCSEAPQYLLLARCLKCGRTTRVILLGVVVLDAHLTRRKQAEKG